MPSLLITALSAFRKLSVLHPTPTPAGSILTAALERWEGPCGEAAVPGIPGFGGKKKGNWKGKGEKRGMEEGEREEGSGEGGRGKEGKTLLSGRETGEMWAQQVRRRELV